RNGDPEQVVRARHAVDGEEGADVGEGQREDRVLELDERGDAPRIGGDGHVCRCAVSSPARSFSACSRAGRRTANPSRAPPVEPGRFTTSVCPRTPATPRESKPCAVLATASVRI